MHHTISITENGALQAAGGAAIFRNPIDIYIYIYMYIHIWFKRKRIFMCVCVYIHIWLYMYIYTHADMCVWSSLPNLLSAEALWSGFDPAGLFP